ncbi:Casein kinase substrate, phosphoprotein PP28 [Corchorus olitorius]|uniref:Casein kinase substrate, phosphoprotein PP28 n=1 Tax=Corchorus olitorius TaxID=93759 RepID=A0A1R3KJI9_9ROSI|nr:Casein kinase substrate, phosphoprotein PP28 [Corchorus olitorius]
MARGKTKPKRTGQRTFSSVEEILAGTSSRPSTFTQREAKYNEDEESKRGFRQESEEESDDETEKEQKQKGIQGLIEINNPNWVKPKNVKVRDIDIGKTTELSRREREEIEKQEANERHMKRQEQGKTEKARNNLERLALIRQEREEAAKKREEEKAVKEQRKAEARK